MVASNTRVPMLPTSQGSAESTSDHPVAYFYSIDIDVELKSMTGIAVTPDCGRVSEPNKKKGAIKAAAMQN